MTPHSGLPGAASEAPTWISQLGFPECGRQRRWGARGAGQDTQQGEGKGKVRGGQSPPEGGSSREKGRGNEVTGAENEMENGWGHGVEKGRRGREGGRGMGKTTEEREERRKVTGRHRQPEVRRQNEKTE